MVEPADTSVVEPADTSVVELVETQVALEPVKTRPTNRPSGRRTGHPT
jgi:hypothetical protein